MIKVWLMVRIEAGMIIHLLNFLHHLHPPIHHINHHYVTYQLIFLHHLHPRIHHNNYHHITHSLIFLNYHYCTPLHPLMNLQLVFFRYCSATKRPRYYAATSNLLFKMFGQELGM